MNTDRRGELREARIAREGDGGTGTGDSHAESPVPEPYPARYGASRRDADREQDEAMKVGEGGWVRYAGAGRKGDALR